MSESPLSAESFPGRPGSVAVPLASGIHHRWSPRRYDGERTVEPEDLRAVLEAARWSASCFGEEPWRFGVARRHDSWRPEVEAALSPGNAWARRAGVLLLGVTRRTFSRNDEPNRYARHDLGMALTSMMVEAMARGLITHAMAGFDDDATRTAFAIPTAFDVVWTLALGHYDPDLEDADLTRRDTRDRQRRPLQESLFGPRFGETVDL